MVTVIESGRKRVCLLWLEQHPALPDNYQIVLFQLQNTVQKLKTEVIPKKYEKVCNAWENEEIIS